MKKKHINNRLDTIDNTINYLLAENILNKHRIQVNPNQEEKRFRTIQRTLTKLQLKLQEKDDEIHHLKVVLDEYRRVTK